MSRVPSVLISQAGLSFSRDVTDRMNHDPGILTANAAIITSHDGKVDRILVGDITVSNTTIRSSGTLTISAANGVNFANTRISGIPEPTSPDHPVNLAYFTRVGTGSNTMLLSIDTGTASDTLLLPNDTLYVLGSAGVVTRISNNTITISLANTAVSSGTYGSANSIPSFVVDSTGRITSAGSYPLVIGNAATATTLRTARSINGVLFDGSANITLPQANTITFNASGTGNSAGTVFNGNSAVVISYNTVGAASAAGANTITTVGTIVSGIWNATAISPSKGGTGVDNGSRTITLGGDLRVANSFSVESNYAIVLNATGPTNITLPQSGTVATTDQIETLSNKTLASPVISGPLVVGHVQANTISSVTFVGVLAGNANTATALQTARTINGVLFDGSADIVLPVPTANTIGAAPAAGANTITTVGDIIAGTWNGTIISPAKGGTGVDNGSRTMSLGGNLTTANTLTIAMLGASSVTFPTSGILATRSSIETLTNKTLASPVISGIATANSIATAWLSANNVSANIVTSSSFVGPLTGNASTATALQTARSINGVLFDGSADIVLPTPTANTIGAAPAAGANTITTVGDITVGTWNGTIISPAKGGTGVDNGSRTISIGGNLTTANTVAVIGNFPLSLTLVAGTTVVIPANGTLVTRTSTETLLNKTIVSPIITGVATISANAVFTSGVSANGSFGTSGQVLATNGAGVYWTDVAAGSGPSANTGTQLNTLEVTCDFGSEFSDKAQTVVTGQSWVTSTSIILASVRTPNGVDPDEMRLLKISATVSDLVVGTGFTVTLFSDHEAKGIYTVNCIGG